MRMKIRQGIKRRLIQIAAFGFSNIHVENFAKGRIYTGAWKQFCNPGLNCYSCPAASLACPIGAMQAAGGAMNFKFGFYAAGFLLAVGTLLGRTVCGFLCPFGLIQELIGKIPVKKIRLPKPLRYLKYAVLVIFVLLLPALNTDFMGMGKPAFCQYICPAGTLMGGLPLLAANRELSQMAGVLFSLKAAILAAVIAGCMFCHRFFCKALCPLGAIYGLLNKVSLYRLRIDKARCVGCGSCAKSCKMDVDPVKTPDSAECIRCGECVAACPAKAITLGFAPKREKAQESQASQKNG